MVHYKLIYFDLRGRAETIRQLFVLGGVPFEDCRISGEEWDVIKKDSPFGYLPILEVDRQPMGESLAIYRFLARRFGFAGKSDLESYQIDALGDVLQEQLMFIRPYVGMYFWKYPGDEEKTLHEVVVPAVTKGFGIMVKQLKSSESGYLVGEQLSWIDLAVAENFSTLLEHFPPELMNQFPELVEHSKKVYSNEILSKWIKERPETIY